jgi:hypothetical protein
MSAAPVVDRAGTGPGTLAPETRSPHPGRHRRRWVGRQWRSHRWRTLLVLAAAMSVLAAGCWVVLLRGGRAEEASTDEAVERFESGSTTTVGAPGGEATAGVFALPEEGVYQYFGSGTVKVSVLPIDQPVGPSMPTTVADEGSGCFSWQLELNTHHHQSFVYCVRDGALVESGGISFQRWDLGFATYDVTSWFVADPPMVLLPADREPGDTWPIRTEGTHSTLEGTVVMEGTGTYLGREVISVQGTNVEVEHIILDRTISGAQTGTEVSERWLAADTGLPVKGTRTVEATSDTPVGAVTFTEDSVFVLDALRPIS